MTEANKQVLIVISPVVWNELKRRSRRQFWNRKLRKFIKSRVSVYSYDDYDIVIDSRGRKVKG